jgi:UDP-2,3-diacylglucosamine hydrolase
MGGLTPAGSLADGGMLQVPIFEAPSGWRCIDFVSDLHLAADTPDGFGAFVAYLNGTVADAVFVLGDLFDAWVGDDSRHEGFEARGAMALRTAAGLRTLGFMAGNRDFLLGDEMLAACGMARLADPTVLRAFGTRALLTHGDALCLEDVEYQRFRRVVRAPTWQAEVLAMPLAERRLLARNLRAESERQGAARGPDQFDIDRPVALAWMHAAGAPTLIHGHTHRPADEELATGAMRRVLSDWELDHGGGRAEVLRWTSTGFARIAPADAATAAD